MKDNSINYSNSRLKGIREYNETTKLKISDLEAIFTQKNYVLITKTYINSVQNLEFICSRHHSLGIQKTTATRLRKLPHNCSDCQRECNVLKQINKILSISPLEWYKKILNGEIKTFPNGFFQNYKLKDLKELLVYFEKIVIESENINGALIYSHTLLKKYRLSALTNNYSAYEILNMVHPNKYQVWEMASCPPNYWNNESNVKYACEWFYKKLHEDKIIQCDEDILEIKNFGMLFKKYKLDGMFYTIFNSSHYRFWNQLFPNRWLEWEYKMTPKYYWELKENRLKSLKELIEFKLNIEFDDIPEKISYPFLVDYNRKFGAICDLYYQSDIFLWVNECYPNHFNKEDFYNNIAKDGTRLDSKDEVLIHNKMLDNNLKLTYFENKQTAMKDYYNKDEDESYVPDWIVNDKIILEYFGWYNQKQYMKNSTITSYIDKANRKINYYKKQDGFVFIDLYPEDIKNNFHGMVEKFKKCHLDIVV